MRRLAVAVGFLTFAVSPAVAAPMVDQAHEITQSVGGLILFTGRASAQSFTAGASGVLSQIDVLLSRDVGDIGDLSLDVWPVVGEGPAGVEPLFSVPIDTSTIPTGSADYVPVDVSTGGLTVSAGQQYAFSLSATADLGGDNAVWTRGRPGYDGGGKFAFDGSWRVDSPDFDFGFRTWVDPSLASGPSVSIAPDFDVEANFPSFGLPFLIDGSPDITVARERSGPGDDRRAMMEFDLSQLPEGATVTGMSLDLDLVGLSSTSVNKPNVEVFAYVGDGTPRPANADDLSNPVGQSGPIEQLDPFSIPLSTASINGVLNGDDQLGLVLYQGTPTVDVDIVASETQFPQFFAPPALRVSYDMPSASRKPEGDYNGDARVDSADYTFWRDADGATGASSADGNGDGTVNEQDYNLWLANYGTAPDDSIENGDFATGDLNGWDVAVGDNTTVQFGFPRVETFDVDGDGSSDEAMRLRLGRTDTDQFGGQVSISQEVLLEGGDYLLTVDVASQSLDSGGNTAPGNFLLYFDEEVVDQVLQGGTLIGSLEVIRDRLAVTLLDVQPGYHDISVLVARGATNFASIYQFIDNIELTRLPPSAAVPEPATLVPALLGIGLATRKRR